MNPLYQTVDEAIELVDKTVERQNVEAQRLRIQAINTALGALHNSVVTLRRVQAIGEEVFQLEAQVAEEKLRTALGSIFADMTSADEILDLDDARQRIYQQRIAQAGPIIEDQAKALNTELDRVTAEWKARLSRTRTIMRIPDLAAQVKRKGDLQAVLAEMERFLSTCQNDTSTPSQLAKRWQALQAKYRKLGTIGSFDELKERYNFSDATIQVIEELLSGKAVRLDQIDVTVLNQLTTFKSFCKAISLKFIVAEGNP
jgi:hypothetical protein